MKSPACSTCSRKVGGFVELYDAEISSRDQSLLGGELGGDLVAVPNIHMR